MAEGHRRVSLRIGVVLLHGVLRVAHSAAGGAGWEAWDLHLWPGSPLIDAGDPLVSDPDGSPSDVGGWSGPEAGLIDLDGDGAPSWWQPRPYDSALDPAAGWDCDDLDPAVGPYSGCGP